MDFIEVKRNSDLSLHMTLNQECRSLSSIGGDNLQFYPNFALFSTWGDEPRPRFCLGEQIKWRPTKKKRKKEVFIKTETLFSPNLGEDQKKGLHQKSNTFFHQTQVKTKKKRSSPKIEHFFPVIQVDTYAQMHTRVKLLGGCRCRPCSNYWGWYS